MKVAVIGTGHVGLPTAAALAHSGHDVVACDADQGKIDMLQAGGMPFHEPGMDSLVAEQVAAGRLRFTADPADAIPGSDVVFLCVGTPARADGEANLLAVELAAQTVAAHATGEVVVVEKSTVPAGTAERIAQTLAMLNGHSRFSVVSNPEFLREGTAVPDSLRPERILVGSDCPHALQVMRKLYSPMVDAGATWLQTDLRTAELSKHACNAFLALKISFANALARVCELAAADVTEVVRVMGSDARIGSAYLNAGLGYGGYCFPKDVAAFERLAARLGYEFRLLQEVARINDEAVDAAFSKIEHALWNLEGKRVVLMGLAFKPGTDDVRDAPALRLAQRLVDAGCVVVGYDPQAGETAKYELPELEIAGDPYDAVRGAQCVVISTEWPQFRDLDLDRMRTLVRMPILVDGRNLLDPGRVTDAGFVYIPTGRPPATDLSFSSASPEPLPARRQAAAAARV